MRRHPVIAIDGPSGAGKSTVARGLARVLGFGFVDTGAIYRTVALLADQEAVEWTDEDAVAKLALAHKFSFDPDGNLSLDGEPVGNAIRSPRMSMGASAVASLPLVRQALLSIQRSLGSDGKIVLEGRDIGTVVFADAEMKFFLTAGVQARAVRRFSELVAAGRRTTLEEVEAEQERRDRSDREREISPLRKAEDAEEINCDDMSADEVIALMKSRIDARFPLTST